MASMAEILTLETVPNYVSNHIGDIEIFAQEAKLTARVITGGNVNYAFQVVEEDSPDKSVFVKQAPEYVAIFGPGGFPLTSRRMQLEFDVYTEWSKVLGPVLTRKYLPHIYNFDNERMVFIMEFFDGFTLLDHDLVGDTVVPNDVAIGLGEFLGKVHAATHCSKVSKSRADYLMMKFENRAMRDVQLEFVFTKCYKEATEDQKAGLDVDHLFLKEVEMLKAAYDGRVTDNLALCHGDLHPGSVMVKEGETKVIDPEFTIYGPPGLDVGSLLSGYVLAAVHQAYSNRPESVVSVCRNAESIWSSYQKIWRSVVYLLK